MRTHDVLYEVLERIFALIGITNGRPADISTSFLE